MLVVFKVKVKKSDRLIKIAEFRLSQPLSELKRKSYKAISRSDLWSQEELDYIKAKARITAESIRWK